MLRMSADFRKHRLSWMTLFALAGVVLCVVANVLLAILFAYREDGWTVVVCVDALIMSIFIGGPTIWVKYLDHHHNRRRRFC